ncbi:MAG: hypothetical protein FWC23_05010 [Chitinispirillia bacterium]|nr:hypothetical protein [Chitinispirillia bacterium]MCL2268527.1 hypothetical protein [Chitinispirillia bacterium]
MLRKLAFLVPAVVVAAVVFTGCVPPTAVTNTGKRDAVNTIKYWESANPKVIVTPTIVDLEVSETKVQGTAKGNFTGANKSSVRDIAEQAAIAEALKQREGADVLVGVIFYYTENRVTYERGELTVTAIGYPARYKNFRPYKFEEGKDGSGKSLILDDLIRPSNPGDGAH